jgi:hypothetical protein
VETVILKQEQIIVFVPYIETMEEAIFIKKNIQGPISIAAGMPITLIIFLQQIYKI